MNNKQNMELKIDMSTLEHEKVKYFMNFEDR